MAWIEQAMSDLRAAHRLENRNDPRTFCQAISKYQQAVEKAVKGVAAVLQHGGVFSSGPGNRHAVNPLILALLNVPRSDENRELIKKMDQLFLPHRQRDIADLDALAPVYPDPGKLHARNHEYPFQDSSGAWHPPCEPNHRDAFKIGEVKRFSVTANRVCAILQEIVLALELIYP
ncbi:MAG: HEPN domain-containing protein [Tepidisphaeraceae bacterium]